MRDPLVSLGRQRDKSAEKGRGNISKGAWPRRRTGFSQDQSDWFRRAEERLRNERQLDSQISAQRRRKPP